ncbi:hypothetical protein [Actinomadura sp. NBRC 104425]|uniref:hypothetical protein n=1 Tax=Actinomadura sp. NBRC 104425 TaxID=3032204 RepID=UPI0025554163|nr:hypothetical protein [Actinomadura sp. NBRC 104425]
MTQQQDGFRPVDTAELGQRIRGAVWGTAATGALGVWNYFPAEKAVDHSRKWADVEKLDVGDVVTLVFASGFAAATVACLVLGLVASAEGTRNISRPAVAFGLFALVAYTWLLFTVEEVYERPGAALGVPILIAYVVVFLTVAAGRPEPKERKKLARQQSWMDKDFGTVDRRFRP